MPDNCCNSVAIDFVGPLPLEEGYNSLVTFTNRLRSDIRIIPMTTLLTAKKFILLFFKH